jgi:hypothetical protein
MSLEDEFEIDVSDDEASRLHTVDDILACVPGGCRKEKSGSDQSGGLIVSGRPFFRPMRRESLALHHCDAHLQLIVDSDHRASAAERQGYARSSRLFKPDKGDSCIASHSAPTGLSGESSRSCGASGAIAAQRPPGFDP